MPCHSRLSPNGLPQLSWPIGEGFQDVLLLPLTEEDAASFRLNGNENIYSEIRLTTQGGRHRLLKMLQSEFKS